MRKVEHYIFTFDVTLYLVNWGFFISTPLKNLHTKGCGQIFKEFSNWKKGRWCIFCSFFSYCNLNLIYRALLKNETVIYIYIKYINVEKKLSAKKKPHPFFMICPILFLCWFVPRGVEYLRASTGTPLYLNGYMLRNNPDVLRLQSQPGKSASDTQNKTWCFSLQL